MVTVYSGEGDAEYETLESKDANQAFQDYMATRRAGGEKIMAESPVIVTRNGARRVEVTTLRSSLGKLFRRAGLRTERKKRHEVQINHGFRKFFDNVAKDHIDEAYVEKLIGHNTGTKEHYDRHLPKPLIEEYLVAMPYLSIDEAYRAEAKLSKELEESKKVHSEDFNEVRLQLLETRAQLDEERRKREESETRTVELVEEGRKLLEEMRAEKRRKGPR